MEREKQARRNETVPQAVSLTHWDAHLRLSEWAGAELGEIRQHWYAAVSPGFQDHTGGYRSLTDNSDKGQRIDRCGYVMSVLMINRPVHHKALRRAYMDGGRLGARARRAALDAFCRVWVTWDFVHDPLNAE